MARSLVLLSVILFSAVVTYGAPFKAAKMSSKRVHIPAGEYQPLFGSAGDKLSVVEFWIDGVAVTNADFQKFLGSNPAWQKKQIKPAYGDKSYLSHWTEKGPSAADAVRPIVFVSWFAANSYCASQGGRLPSTLEWEYVSGASRDQRDASKDAKFQDEILRRYVMPSEKISEDKDRNFYGVQGLLGSNWEWTSDFNAFFVTADSRQDGDQAKNFFCGGASTAAADKSLYPAFMRYALRSSLQATYSLHNLGFRCAYDKAH